MPNAPVDGIHGDGIERVPLHNLLKSKDGNAIRKDVDVIAVIRQTDTVSRDHALRSHRVEIVYVDVVCLCAFDAEQAVLARLAVARDGAGCCGRLGSQFCVYGDYMQSACWGRALTGVVVVVEAVQACAVAVDVVGIDDAQAPCFAGFRVRLAGGVVEAVEPWERMLRAGGWLVVGCFGLDLAHEDVFGVGELVLVEGVVLDCCADAG